MEISEQGLQLIAAFEGVVLHPYVDPATKGEPITIGIGSTHYCDGRKVTLKDPGITIDLAHAMVKCFLAREVMPYLNRTFPNLTQAQFDALCSFEYNLGQVLDKSSLKGAILSGASAEEITTDFCKWDRAAGHEIPSLLHRRQHEAKLFNTGQYN